MIERRFDFIYRDFLDNKDGQGCERPGAREGNRCQLPDKCPEWVEGSGCRKPTHPKNKI